LGLPDNRLDTVPLLDVVKHIEAFVDEIGPDIVYTHHAGDLNIDHRIVHLATLTACRPLPGSTVKSLLCFETPSSSEWGSDKPSFAPNKWVNIHETIQQKVDALGAYGQEMRPFPHARSIEAIRALAKMRGASVGLSAAESFMIIREVA